MKFLASIIYIFLISALFLIKANFGIYYMSSYYDLLLPGVIPLIHFVAVKFVFDNLATDMSIRKSDYIYAIPIFYPLLFNMLFLVTDKSNVVEILKKFSTDDFLFVLLVFGLNFSLILIALIPTKKKHTTKAFAEPIFENKEISMPVKQCDSMNDVYSYILIIIVFFSILLLPLCARL